MKKIYTLTILLLAGLFLQAQTGSKILRINTRTGEHHQNEIQKVFGQKWSDWNLQNRLSANPFYQYKSLATTKQKMDSVISEYRDNQASPWIKEERELYEYDNRGYLSRYSYFDWDEDQDSWAGYEMQETTFDADGNLELMVDYYWEDGENKWILSAKYEHVYEDGVIRYDRDYTWDDTENKWVSDGIWTYEYTDGLLTTLTLTGKDVNYDGNIDNLDGMRSTYSYDDQGLLILEYTLTYIDDETGWMEYFKTEYTYDSNHRLTSMILAMQEPGTQNWTNFMKIEYTYDSSGNQISVVGYMWGINGETWTASYMDEYVYTAKGSVESITSSFRDTETGEMVGESRGVYFYNEDYSIDDLIMPYFIPAGYFKHMVTGFSYYEFSEGSWVMTGRGNIYYSDFQGSGIDMVELPAIAVYPNPASGLVNVTGNGLDFNTMVSLYDSFGRLVTKVRLPESRQIPVQYLPGGLYFYRIQTGTSLIKGKLMIR